jgi:purine-cytosine permease-like protein
VLKIAGALYLLLSAAMVAIAFVTYQRRRQPFSSDDLIKWLGVPGLAVWAFMVLALVARALVFPFTAAIHLWGWLNEVLGAAAVGIILVAIVAIAAVYVVDQRRRAPQS